MPGPSDSEHVYGMPDPDNRQPVPEQGFRGEQGAAKPLRTDLAHSVQTPQGTTLELQEQSGVAFAESSGLGEGQGADEASSAPPGDAHRA
jgi:hypothetical protein